MLQVISYVAVTLFALFCLLPFIMMLSASFSSEAADQAERLRPACPKDFTLTAYEWIFKAPRQIIGSYIVTIVMTVFGTAIGLFIIAMTGYALNRQDFPFRNHISFFIYFTTLFSAGLAPTFLWIARDLGLRGNYLAVFLQLLMTPWLIILMKNFMRTVPYEIIESGKVDGAGDFRIFAQLVPADDEAGARDGRACSSRSATGTSGTCRRSIWAARSSSNRCSTTSTT